MTIYHMVPTLSQHWMVKMSGNIRKQLGPVSKRLQDRIDEASLLFGEDDTTKLKTTRAKLFANMNSHQTLIQKLENIGTLEQDEQAIVDALLEKQVVLDMDACEVLQMLDDAINPS